jgi:DNA adenine methylase
MELNFMLESVPEHQSISPTRPIAAYVGGKRNLARQVIERIGAVPHTIYVEPFVGMGGIFLRRPSRPKSEVINDISSDVSTLFRILQRHYVPFMEMLKWQISSRAEFERLVKTDPSTLTDLERAARFLYLQRLAFGGKVAGRNFGVSPAVAGRFDITRLASMLEDVHERLAGVVIERLPYSVLLKRYDTPQTLFYLDPPYWGCEKVYGPGVFDRADFGRLAEQLAGLKGRFILSINDNPEVQKLFAAFRLESVKTTYSVSGQKQPAAELLISGSS